MAIDVDLFIILLKKQLINKDIDIKMALQLGLRRGLLASNGVNSSLARSTISKSSFGGISQMRMKSTDAGDVIGIDLGTTNSCVAIMVRLKTV